MRPTIWVTEPIHDAAIRRLESAASILGPDTQGRDLSDEVLGTVDAIIVRAFRVDRALVQRMPRLRIVGKHGAGTDNIDAAALTAAGATLLTAPGTNAGSVADLAVAFALMLLRAPDLYDRDLRGGTSRPAARLGYELGELTAGILGVGAIGQAVADRIRRGFGAEVLGYDPGLSADEWPGGIHRREELDSLLVRAQILFLHLPLLPQTRGLIGARELALLPKGAFLVNCARGGIVDEGALADALTSGHLAGAAADVFATEPPPRDHPLFDTPRFIGTPHIGAATNAGLRRTGLMIAERVLDALNQTDRKENT